MEFNNCVLTCQNSNDHNIFPEIDTKNSIIINNMHCKQETNRDLNHSRKNPEKSREFPQQNSHPCLLHNKPRTSSLPGQSRVDDHQTKRRVENNTRQEQKVIFNLWDACNRRDDMIPLTPITVVEHNHGYGTF